VVVPLALSVERPCVEAGEGEREILLESRIEAVGTLEAHPRSLRLLKLLAQPREEREGPGLGPHKVHELPGPLDLAVRLLRRLEDDRGAGLEIVLAGHKPQELAEAPQDLHGAHHDLLQLDLDQVLGRDPLLESGHALDQREVVLDALREGPRGASAPAENGCDVVVRAPQDVEELDGDLHLLAEALQEPRPADQCRRREVPVLVADHTEIPEPPLPLPGHKVGVPGTEPPGLREALRVPQEIVEDLVPPEAVTKGLERVRLVGDDGIRVGIDQGSHQAVPAPRVPDEEREGLHLPEDVPVAGGLPGADRVTGGELDLATDVANERPHDMNPFAFADRIDKSDNTLLWDGLKIQKRK